MFCESAPVSFNVPPGINNFIRDILEIIHTQNKDLRSMNCLPTVESRHISVLLKTELIVTATTLCLCICLIKRRAEETQTVNMEGIFWLRFKG